jgi:hypothetical protein
MFFNLEKPLNIGGNKKISLDYTLLYGDVRMIIKASNLSC